MAIVLATASVICNDPNTVLNTIDDRRAQYISACTEWLQNPAVSCLVICENTNDEFLGAELKILADNIGKQLEYICFSGDANKVAAYGKGYGEGEIINYALHHSRVIGSTQDGFYKISGRLSVKNFTEISRKINPYDNYFKLMATRLNMDRQVDTRFFYVQPEFYEKWLSKSYLAVRDRRKYYLEHEFYRLLKNSRYIKSFPLFPRIAGSSATLGKEYAQENKDYLRSLLNHIGLYSV